MSEVQMVSHAHKPVLSEWQIALNTCQDEISRLCQNLYYKSNYRQAELSYWQHIPRWLYADIKESPPSSCLDIGCAYGTLLFYVQRLSGCEAYGVDFMNAYMSSSLLEQYGLHFAVANIELDPLPWTQTFDVILLTEVLEHWNFNPLPTLRKIRELLSPHGRLYLSTPDARDWGRVTKYYTSYQQMPVPSRIPGQVILDDHIWVYDQTELLELMQAAHLSIERIDYSTGGVGRHFNLVLRRMDS